MELDPPVIRISRTSNNVLECTQTFDPVGTESANDLAVVPQVVALKARIEDHANTAPGLLVSRHSGLDKDSIFLYVMPATVPGTNTPQALNVDADGDAGHNCDSINPLVTPVSTMITSANQAPRA